jgi:hypothetical protein
MNVDMRRNTDTDTDTDILVDSGRGHRRGQ